MYKETQADKDRRAARKKALVAMRQVMDDMDYVLVQEWREPHGNGGSETYQHWDPSRRKTLKVISYDREGLTSFSDDESSEKKNYLLAREIQTLGTARGWPVERVGPPAVSPCATAGYQDYREAGNLPESSRRYYRITAVAGHGSYAFAIKKDEAGKPWTD